MSVKIKISFFLIILALGLRPVSLVAQERKARVVTTLFALYDFVREVGGDRVEVTLLLPPGVEAHAFEPKPRDVARISQADIFVYAGAGMEPWVADILQGLDASRLMVVDASRGLDLIAGHDHNEARAAPEPGHNQDPHAWLDFSNAEKIVGAIGAALATKDPANALFYIQRAQAYQERLRRLDQDYRSAFASCPRRAVLFAGHMVFGYWTRRYGLEFVSPYHGFSPDAEPTPRRLAGFIELSRKAGARFICHEELVDPKVARVIAEEIGAELLMLHGAHNITSEEKDRNVTFMSLMEENLKNLKKGVLC